MRRGSAGPAPWQQWPIPTHLQQQTFSSLPYDTHPIDLVVQPQGWGPFPRQWQQVDFRQPENQVDIGYSKGNVQPYLPPGYNNQTLFESQALTSANNESWRSRLANAIRNAGMSSTAKQSQTVVGNTQSRVLSQLGLGGGS